ncbi:YfiR family protein [Candidatus Venteria ishoeyi]|uniref:YfiR family protein n=1 Tax=Candidatus Venteria ishoeyi TaxID=1899563 RepID=UPI0015B16C13|nr:YfiR family protein [Candidatus Venteria ishoeyi]
MLRKSLFFLIFCLVSNSSFGDPSTENNPALWHKKKAGVLYNLSKFIDWPDAAFGKEQTFNICVFGETPFFAALKTFEKRQIRGKAVRIHTQRLQTLNTLSCQTLYISASSAASFSTILSSVHNKPILTISDMPDFISQGGMIGLIQAKQRVRFMINLDAAKSVKLLISAPLLRLAKSVKYRKTRLDNPE